MPQYDTSVVWKHLLAIKVPAKDRVNVFMAVPTIYSKLLQEYDDIFSRNERMREYVKAACTKNIRLMVSGSASLPVPVLERWEEVTGHRLLERYGMSEIGMALSNPLKGERVAGKYKFSQSILPNQRISNTKHLCWGQNKNFFQKCLNAFISSDFSVLVEDFALLNCLTCIVQASNILWRYLYILILKSRAAKS